MISLLNIALIIGGSLSALGFYIVLKHDGGKVVKITLISSLVYIIPLILYFVFLFVSAIYSYGGFYGVARYIDSESFGWAMLLPVIVCYFVFFSSAAVLITGILLRIARKSLLSLYLITVSSTFVILSIVWMVLVSYI